MTTRKSKAKSPPQKSTSEVFREFKAVAADAGYPYHARTNKATTLDLGDNSIPLPSGQDLMVIGEWGDFGTVQTVVSGQHQTGVLDRADYDRA
jgi:hypothetical protein